MQKEIKPFPENHLVEQIQSDLYEYFSNSELKGRITRPENKDQAFENLDKFCGDLVAAYENFGALVLEVKTRTRTIESSFLPAYKEPQHVGLCALKKVGVPVYFSYNECRLEEFKDDSEFSFNLQQIRAPAPDELLIKTASTGRIERIEGCTLLEILQKRVDGNWIHACAALSLVFDGSASQVSSGINDLNTKILVLIYSNSLNKLLLIDEELAKSLIVKVKDRAIFSDSKNGPKFLEALKQVIEDIIQELSKINTESLDSDPPPVPRFNKI